jgi:glutaredoxin-related protein
MSIADRIQSEITANPVMLYMKAFRPGWCRS